MSMIVVTHDLGVLADFCDTAVVMYAGEVVEQGRVEDVLSAPAMPYTAGLLGSNPYSATPMGRLPAIPGTVPLPSAWPTGCRFQARCDRATELCSRGPIPLTEVSDLWQARCIRIGERAAHD